MFLGRGMYMWVPAPMESRHIRSPRSGATGGCESPTMGAGNWTLVFYKSSTHSLPQRSLSSLSGLFFLFNISTVQPSIEPSSEHSIYSKHPTFSKAQKRKKKNGGQHMPCWRASPFSPEIKLNWTFWQKINICVGKRLICALLPRYYMHNNPLFV